MKTKIAKELSDAELRSALTESREKLLQLKLRKHTGQVEKTHVLKALRKDIARTKTFLTQRRSNASKA